RGTITKVREYSKSGKQSARKARRLQMNIVTHLEVQEPGAVRIRCAAKPVFRLDLQSRERYPPSWLFAGVVRNAGLASVRKTLSQL
ncbi:hypothetical protein, partial [Nitrobacter winogradskyi]|uniref:hypothetical protein n=1 Tax=Nitrobacter winogradskyi TaxID=913 RepID=UPI001AEDC4C5